MFSFQFIPNKAHCYGIKLFKLCSVDRYTWAMKVYCGKSAIGEQEVELAKKVCLKVAQKLLEKGNFYTSYELALSLLENKIHLVGTLRANKKDIPKTVLEAKLKRGELISNEDKKMVWLS